MKPLYLAGFMGVGKSTIGTLLAQRLGHTFLDLDDVIVEHVGMPIKDIFQIKGEKYFSEIEAQVLESVANDETVLALGGGTLMNQRSMELLKSRGIIVYLRASNETLVDRLRNEVQGRPLLRQTEPLEEIVESIMRERSSTYESADLIVDVDGLSAQEVTDTLFGMISN
jgi:shikimate kinase